MIDKAKLLEIIKERQKNCFNPQQTEFDQGYARALHHLKSDIIMKKFDKELTP